MGISIILYPATAIESAANASFNALVELKATVNEASPPVQSTHVSMAELLDASAYIRAGARYESKD
jgi:hypothetical protein